MSEEPVLPEVAKPDWLDLPEPFEIPSELIEGWAALPKDFRFAPTLPRVSWDALYQAIDQLNFAILAGTRMATSVTRSESDLKAAATQLGSHSIRAQNSLRQFQAMMMAEALKAHNDA
jgi:hypothetical protein